MSTEVEHPEIRYVMYPVHMDGTLTGELPRKRHDPDCGHFKFRGGLTLGTPVLASEEQMRTLEPCITCVNKRAQSAVGGGSPRTPN